jgi:hypothetical protein
VQASVQGTKAGPSEDKSFTEFSMQPCESILKVHKREIFLGSNFECYTFSLLFMLKYSNIPAQKNFGDLTP